MDAKHFDDLTRALHVGHSRRSLLGGLPLGLLAALPVPPLTIARRRKKHRRKRGAFCAGKNSCTDHVGTCNARGEIQCNCMRLAETGKSVCVGAVGSFDCTACGPDEVCVDLVGCSPTSDRGCARPCPTPR
jgi:hypothetical protein